MKKTSALLLVCLGVVAVSAWRGGFSYLLSTNYLPHRYCYLIQPGLIWTNAAMDALIAGSYLVIFLALFWMAAKLSHVPELKSYLWILFAFGSFIVACGFTHVMEIVTIWWPVYRASAAVKVICAAASIPTAILFVRAAPPLAANMERFLVMLSTTQQEKEHALNSLIAAEKLAVAGRISASIAHEIKNPLDTVSNVLDLLKTDPAFSPELLELLNMAEGELRRADHIAGSTLSLYRESKSSVKTDLVPLVEEIVELQSAAMLRHNIVVNLRLNAPTPIHAYPGELRQVLINLMQNAAAAIGQDGEIFVRVRPSGTGYAITIADDGPGISEKNRAQIFNLFFTTKGEQGTGLGLWLVKSLVEKHGGKIAFKSRTIEEGFSHGTVFRIWLPYEPVVSGTMLQEMASGAV